MLSNGIFSIVSKAVLDNQYVVKKIPKASSKARGYFSNETRIHQTLNHMNIVTFLALWSTPEPTLVTKFVGGGDLHQMVRDNTKTLSLDFQLSIAIEVAQGLNYLHTLNILHRDIKAQNVFLEETSHGLQAKIGDFGFSVYESDAPFMDLSGSPIAFSPELFRCMGKPPCLFSKKSDVYAYAVLLWQLVSGANPKRLKMRSIEELGERIMLGQRMPIPKQTPVDFSALIRLCWQQKAYDRPLTDTILMLLYKIKEKLIQPKQTERQIRVGYGLKNHSGSLGMFGDRAALRANTVSLSGEFETMNGVAQKYSV